MCHIYARIINQYSFSYQTVFSGTFDKQDEDNQVLDEIEFSFNLLLFETQQSLILIIFMLDLTKTPDSNSRPKGLWLEI